MNETRCGACPVAPGRRCHAEALPLLCEWAESGDAVKVAHVVNRSAIAEAPASFPPLAAQAANLAGAAGRFVVSGLKVATPAEQERRLAICRGTDAAPACEHFAPGPPGRCTLCGCVARWKARLSSEHCPLDSPRW